MYRGALPVVVRNHIAELEFNKNTYKQIFKKSDQGFDSNKKTQTVTAQVAAVQASPADPQVAAVKPQRGGRGGVRGNRGGNRGGRGGNSNNSSNTTNPQPSTPATGNNKGTRHPTAKGHDDKLCKIHFKWGENGTYCAAPWRCPMKDVYKSPQ